jgi:DNA-binding NarL/FixJ family response regulator
MRCASSVSSSGLTVTPRAVLADDHRMVMEGIAELVKDAVRVVALAGCGRSLGEAIVRTSPDIVISDINMPNGGGLDALQSDRSVGRCTPFLFLTMHTEAPLVARAFELGAKGYVLKTAAGEELLRAISRVVAGGTYVTPMLNAKMHRSCEIEHFRLTPRLREVLVLTARGLPAKRVAAHLEVSVRTIEAHRYALMQIFDAHTTLDLVHRATDAGCLFAIDGSDFGKP